MSIEQDNEKEKEQLDSLEGLREQVARGPPASDCVRVVPKSPAQPKPSVLRLLLQ